MAAYGKGKKSIR